MSNIIIIEKDENLSEILEISFSDVGNLFVFKTLPEVPEYLITTANILIIDFDHEKISFSNFNPKIKVIAISYKPYELEKFNVTHLIKKPFDIEEIIFLVKKELILLSNAKTIKFNFTLPANRKYLKRIINFFKEIEKKLHINKKMCFYVTLTVEELITNVIKHAYSFNRGHFYIEVNISKKYCHIVVKDKGKGFKLSKLDYDINNWEKNKLLADNGRGVLLVKSISNNFSIFSSYGHGTRVETLINLE